MAPVFDNDCSLGALQSIQNRTFEECYHELKTNRQTKTDLGGYLAQARKFMTRTYFNNIRNMYPFEFTRLPDNINVEPRRIQYMEYIVNS